MTDIAEFIVRIVLFIVCAVAATFVLQTVFTVYVALASRWSDYLLKRLGSK